jgi:hypothetical protein
MPLTQSDVAQLQARIDAGDRAGFYILYYHTATWAPSLVARHFLHFQ